MTLVKTNDDDSVVYGIGYKIAADKTDKVLNHLDFREKNGYDRYETKFYPTDGSQAKTTLVYLANEQNPSWNKNHKLEDIACQIHEAVGPSGRNTEYVYNLCDAMRQNFHNIKDDHLFNLEQLLKNMETEDSRHSSSQTISRRHTPERWNL